MAGPRLSERAANAGLALVAAAGLALRLWPLLRAGGPLGVSVDYDEGVYFSASALLFRGVLPYRDFVFVHPPGLLYALGLTSSLTGLVGAANALAAARVVAAVAGAANALLAGKLAQRWGGPFAGLLAAALYATYPEVVAVERGPFLEPVLNLACLSAAWVWLSPGTAGSPRRVVAAGALFGAACAVKVWGGIWVLAALASLPSRGWRAPLLFLTGAAGAGALLVGPLALAAPGPFVTDALLFHAWRPPDGDVARLPRLKEIWSGRPETCSALALAGLAFALWQRAARGGLRRAEAPADGGAPRELRFFAAAYALTIVAFLLPTGYWSQYNAHLVASEAVLAGWGGAAMWERLVRPRLRALDRLTPRTRLRLALLAVALVAFPTLRRSALNGRARAPEQLELAERLRRHVPPDACLFSFEPAWGLLGGHLPPHGRPGVPVIVDPYAAMLLDATAGGARYPHVTAAFHDEASQPSARAALERCRFALLGWRGHWQLTEATQAWLAARDAMLAAPISTEHYDLWEQRE